jgi:hypothetical protein
VAVGKAVGSVRGKVAQSVGVSEHEVDAGMLNCFCDSILNSTFFMVVGSVRARVSQCWYVFFIFYFYFILFLFLIFLGRKYHITSMHITAIWAYPSRTLNPKP